MQQHKLISSFLIMICSSLCISQVMTTEAEVLMTHRVIINTENYADIKGSPYVFEDLVAADILDRNGNMIKNITLNYNAFDHRMEITKNGTLTILDEKYYPKVIIKKHNLKKNVDGPLVFVLHKQNSTTQTMYVQQIAYSPMLILLKKYRVAKKESKVNTPGETIVQKKFNMYKEYILFKDGEYLQVKAKVNDFIKILGYEKELKAYAKKNKIKLKTDQEAKEFIDYAISLL